VRSDLLSFALVASGLNRLYARHLAGPGFPILAYHEVKARVLEAHLKALSPYYRFMSLADALAYQGPISSRPPLVLTFDDGYRSWATEVLPVLRKRRIPAVFFACTGFIDRTQLPWYEVLERFLRKNRRATIELEGERFSTRELVRDPDRRRALHAILKSMPHSSLLAHMQGLEQRLSREDREAIQHRYLSWEELEGLCGYDWEIGAHTVSHPILTRVPLSRVREEVEGSRKRLEEKLQRRVRYFAYPNGLPDDLNDMVVGEVRRAGFEAAVTALPGWNPPGIDGYRLRRAVVAPGGSIWRLRAAATGLLGLFEEARRLRVG
jgi:peptidoglycan/xylan/chitin deacetylase (PgdA/CDA1 family)